MTVLPNVRATHAVLPHITSSSLKSIVLFFLVVLSMVYFILCISFYCMRVSGSDLSVWPWSGNVYWSERLMDGSLSDPNTSKLRCCVIVKRMWTKHTQRRPQRCPQVFARHLNKDENLWELKHWIFFVSFEMWKSVLLFFIYISDELWRTSESRGKSDEMYERWRKHVKKQKYNRLTTTRKNVKCVKA